MRGNAEGSNAEGSNAEGTSGHSVRSGVAFRTADRRHDPMDRSRIRERVHGRIGTDGLVHPPGPSRPDSDTFRLTRARPCVMPQGRARSPRRGRGAPGARDGLPSSHVQSSRLYPDRPLGRVRKRETDCPRRIYARSRVPARRPPVARFRFTIPSNGTKDYFTY